MSDLGEARDLKDLHPIMKSVKKQLSDGLVFLKKLILFICKISWESALTKMALSLKQRTVQKQNPLKLQNSETTFIEHLKEFRGHIHDLVILTTAL